MTVTALDTSVIVAALLDWHDAHVPALAAVRDAFTAEAVVPAPALVESYSVMTRLPRRRLSPVDASELLSRTFRDRATVVGLSEKETWRFLSATSDRGAAGGVTYDALILACARKGRATRLVTLNRRDFTRLERNEIEIVTP